MNKLMEENIKEFCIRVESWKETGAPYGLSDLKELAIELGTPIPCFDENLNLVWGHNED